MFNGNEKAFAKNNVLFNQTSNLFLKRYSNVRNSPAEILDDYDYVFCIE